MDKRKIQSLVSTFYKHWDKHCYEITFTASIFILLYIFFFHNGNIGTFTSRYIFTRAQKKRAKCKNKHENRCRSILEDVLYPHSFPSVRPDFLKNPKTGRNLEIDCYNDDLKIGLEYQGIQHRQFSSYYHRHEKDFTSQLERDRYKKQVCKDMGISMIYVPDTVKYNDLERYIKDQLILIIN